METRLLNSGAWKIVEEPSGIEGFLLRSESGVTYQRTGGRGRVGGMPGMSHAIVALSG